MKNLTDKEREVALEVVDSYLDDEVEFFFVYGRDDITEDMDLKAIHDETYRIMQEVQRLFRKEYCR